MIDAGTEAKFFRQKDAFDEMFGTKASSKPAFTLDSGKKGPSTQEDATPSATVSDTSKKESKLKKRKCQKDIVEFLEKADKEFKDTMVTFHNEKMQRLDRFLDLNCFYFVGSDTCMQST